MTAQSEAFVTGIKFAGLAPFPGYANALRDHLSDAVQVLGAFHVVKLGTKVVDEVRRRVQHQTVQHRGDKDDPLCKIRGLLRPGLEHLGERWHTRPKAGLLGPGLGADVELAWACYQRLRAVYAGTASRRTRRKLAEKLLDPLHTYPVLSLPGSAGPYEPGAPRSSCTSTPTAPQHRRDRSDQHAHREGPAARPRLPQSQYWLRMLLAASGTRTRQTP